MSPAKWLLLTFGTGAIVAYAVWWYRTREEPVRGWVWAAVLRAAALTAAWVILLNPLLPMGIGGDGRGAEAVLLDASLSMTRRSEGGRSGWSTALDSVRAYERVWLFGDPVPRFVTTDSLPTEPEYDQTLLAPALRAAAASGVRRALVYTDGVIGDVREAREEARRQGIALSVVDLGHTYAEHGIANLEASSWALAGDSAEVRIEVVAAGMAGDSIPVEILDENGRVVSSARLPGPATGMFTPARLGFAVRGGPGLRRYIVRLASDTPDPEPRDDRRVFYVRVTERPAGPVLLSLRPDWEPSFLIPNLDRLTDAPTSAFLLLADSLVDLDGYRAVSRFAVQRRAEAAPLLVLHGYGADAPEWVQSLANGASRILVLPTGRRGFELLGFGIWIGAPAAGEWYASPEPPRSPLASDLAGIPVDELPPLLDVRAIEADRAWAPLAVQRLRRGEPAPALLAGSEGARRWAVAAAQGYWRWAFRPGPGRQLYRTLWTGVAGWLVAGQATLEWGLDPLRRVVPRDQALHWVTPADIDSLSLEISSDSGTAVWHGTAPVGDSIAAVLAPGRYRYVARAYQSDRVAASANGPVEVEEFATELLPPSGTSIAALTETPSALAEVDSAGQRRGLATLAWPYLVLIALFCAEWGVRRFSGLR